MSDLADIVKRDAAWKLDDLTCYAAQDDRRALLVLLRETREALRDANTIISMMREHLSTEHPDCAYTVLGILNDAGRRALAGPDSEP